MSQQPSDKAAPTVPEDDFIRNGWRSAHERGHVLNYGRPTPACPFCVCVMSLSDIEITDEMLDAGAQHLPSKMGCTCAWDADGNPPPDCRCAERSQLLAREHVRSIVNAVLRAASDTKQETDHG